MLSEREALLQKERRPLQASYVIAYFMILCFAITTIWLIAWLLPWWDSTRMALVCLLVSLEAFLASRLVLQVSIFRAQAIYFRITEWLTILVFLKVFTELRPGVDHFLQNVSLWKQDFITYFFTPDYLLNIFLIFLLWQTCTGFAVDLWKLEIYQSRREREGEGGRAVLRFLLRRYLVVGTLMVVATATMVQDLFGLHRVPDLPWLFPVIALYFLLGLVFLSLTYFFFLRTEWNFEEALVQKNLTGRWLFYSSLILGGLIVIALVLPTYDSIGLLAVVRYVVEFAVSIIAFLAAAIFWLMGSLISGLARLLGWNKLASPASVAPSAPLQFNPPTSGGASGLALGLSFFLWAFFLVLMGIAVRQYLRANQKLAQEVKRWISWHWLATAWIKVKELFQKTSLEVATSVRSGIQRLRSSRASSPLQAGWDIGKVLRLNPRQRIIFYYLTLLRRAEEAGTPRQKWQTPSEYGRTLSARLSEGKESIGEITTSFQEARYSRHEVTQEKADRVKSIWEHLLRILRDRRGRD
ncbi:MAG: DUF4129 domain-containing protein [Anaerolineales bacterium]|jgi:hypothetical protein